jgi:hypothetical protein
VAAVLRVLVAPIVAPAAAAFVTRESGVAVTDNASVSARSTIVVRSIIVRCLLCIVVEWSLSRCVLEGYLHTDVAVLSLPPFIMA